MTTRLAVLLVLLVSFAGAIYVDALDIRVDLDDLDQEEASAVNDLDDILTPNRSEVIRHRWAGRKLPAKLARVFSRLATSSSGGEIETLTASPNRKLYRLQEVFRI